MPTTISISHLIFNSRSRYILNCWQDVCLAMKTAHFSLIVCICAKPLLNHTTILNWGSERKKSWPLLRCLLPASVCAHLCLYFSICLCVIYCGLFVFFAAGMPSISWCRVASPTASWSWQESNTCTSESVRLSGTESQLGPSKNSSTVWFPSFLY